VNYKASEMVFSLTGSE